MTLEPAGRVRDSPTKTRRRKAATARQRESAATRHRPEEARRRATAATLTAPRRDADALRPIPPGPHRARHGHGGLLLAALSQRGDGGDGARLAGARRRPPARGRRGLQPLQATEPGEPPAARRDRRLRRAARDGRGARALRAGTRAHATAGSTPGDCPAASTPRAWSKAGRRSGPWRLSRPAASPPASSTPAATSPPSASPRPASPGGWACATPRAPSVCSAWSRSTGLGAACHLGQLRARRAHPHPRQRTPGDGARRGQRRRPGAHLHRRAWRRR